MKHLYATLMIGVLSLFVNCLHSQTNITNDYVVVSNGGITEISNYTNALDAANWEPYRLQNERFQLSFDNGFSIELKSAIELLNLGYPLNLSNYPLAKPPGYIAPTLELLGGDRIGMRVNTLPGKTH